jgi:hypothetical protein
VSTSVTPTTDPYEELPEAMIIVTVYPNRTLLVRGPFIHKNLFENTKSLLSVPGNKLYFFTLTSIMEIPNALNG